MDVLEQIDESVRRVMVCVSEECGISSKRSRQVIAAKVREALFHEHRLEEESGRIRDGYFHEAWFALASLKGLVAVLGEDTRGVSAKRFQDEAEALKCEILDLAQNAQMISVKKRPCTKYVIEKRFSTRRQHESGTVV